MGVIALANGLPTSPIESVSSGLSAMIHGQGKVSRSAGLVPSPIGSTVPVVQSSPVPMMHDQLGSTVQPFVASSPSGVIISSTVPPPVTTSIVSSGVAKQGLFPSQITSLPGALASQMQGQMSQIQQQVTQVGGSLISQTQDQMSSLQSQMASIPSALGSLVPSSLVPQRAPTSTVLPTIVSTTVPPTVVTSPSLLPVTSQLPIATQSR